MRTRIVEVLRAAKASIDTPEKWGQKWAGSGLAPGCRTMCMGIAFDRAFRMFDNGGQLYGEAVAPLRLAIGGADILDWNDAPERTHAEVMTAYDRAIAIAAPLDPEKPSPTDAPHLGQRFDSEAK